MSHLEGYQGKLYRSMILGVPEPQLLNKTSMWGDFFNQSTKILERFKKSRIILYVKDYTTFKIWSRRGSNPRLPPCRGGALPAELRNRFVYWTILIIAHLLNKSILFMKNIKKQLYLHLK